MKTSGLQDASRCTSNLTSGRICIHQVIQNPFATQTFRTSFDIRLPTFHGPHAFSRLGLGRPSPETPQHWARNEPKPGRQGWGLEPDLGPFGAIGVLFLFFQSPIIDTSGLGRFGCVRAFSLHGETVTRRRSFQKLQVERGRSPYF